MQKIDQVHHDGLGLNDRITIWADERDPGAGGASHRYTASINTEVRDEKGEEIHLEVLDVQFQHRPRHDPEATSGITDAVLLAILIDRMKAFQAGPFSCRENALALTKLEEAHQWLGHRARDRARRGVLGTTQK